MTNDKWQMTNLYLDRAIRQLNKITGIMPTTTIANAGAAASTNRSSDARL
ncbi:hypothetical protein [Coleofasciculus sp.]